MSRTGADCIGCSIHRAARRFASAASEKLARKVIRALQRMPATGIHGDDYRHKTLWDEYCQEVQEGPTDMLESAWAGTIHPFFDALIKTIPHEEAVLLTIAGIWESEDDIEFEDNTVLPDLIRCALESSLAKLARARDMSRFDPMSR